MKLKDLMETFVPEEYISIYNYDTQADQIGEDQLYFGSVRDLSVDDEKLAALEDKKVHAVTMGNVSIIIAV